jgi:hypothetical protein
VREDRLEVQTRSSGDGQFEQAAFMQPSSKTQHKYICLHRFFPLSKYNAKYFGYQSEGSKPWQANVGKCRIGYVFDSKKRHVQCRP